MKAKNLKRVAKVYAKSKTFRKNALRLGGASALYTAGSTRGGADAGTIVAPSGLRSQGRKDGKRVGLASGLATSAAAVGGAVAGEIIFRRVRGRIIPMRKK